VTSCLGMLDTSRHADRGITLTLEHVQANPAQAVDVRVIDPGQEADLGRRHRVVVWKKQLQLEHAPYSSQSWSHKARQSHTFVWRLGGTIDGDVEIAKVVVVWDCRDARHGLLGQPLGLLDDPFWKGGHGR
jgi:hypothetical protein